jgi:hypothetical protein
MTLKELTKFDTAQCSHIIRAKFLFYLKECHISFEEHTAIDCFDFDTVIKCRSSVALYLWLELRNVNINSLYLSNANIESAHLHLSQQLPKVHRVFIAVTQMTFFSLVSKLLSDCVDLEEIYFYSCDILNTPCDHDDLVLSVIFRTIVSHCFKLRVIVYHCASESFIPYKDLMQLCQNCPALEIVDVGSFVNDELVISLCENCPNISTVDFQKGITVSDMSLFALSNIPKLTDFHAGKCDFSFDALIMLIKFQNGNLRTARFGANPEFFNPALLPCLSATQPNLTTLSMNNGPHITDADITVLCNSCIFLSDICIKRCPKLTVRGAILTITNRLVFLSRISFHQNRSNTTKEMFCVLANRFKEFCEVDFSSYAIRGIPVDGFLTVQPADVLVCEVNSLSSSVWFDNIFADILMSRCTQLHTFIITEFHFNFSAVFDKFIWLCENLKVLSLRRINISQLVNPLLHHKCRIHDDDGMCSSDLCDDSLLIIALRCPNLESLDLGKRYRLTDSVMVHLAKGCPKLTYLDLNSCSNLGDVTICAIGKYCNHLHDLRIDYCFLSDVGVIDLALGCPKLVYLSKNYTRGIVTIDYINFLVDCCPDLQRISSSHGEFAYSVQKGVHVTVDNRFCSNLICKCK